MIYEIKLLKEKIEEVKVNESEIIESYEIEKITVQSLEAYLKTLEKDCTKLMHKADVKMQATKKEKHKLRVKAFHVRKETETNKKEIKRYKSCLESAKKSDKNLTTKCA